MRELKDAIDKEDPCDHFVAVDGTDDDLAALPNHFVRDSGCVNATPHRSETGPH